VVNIFVESVEEVLKEHSRIVNECSQDYELEVTAGDWLLLYLC